MWRRMSPRSSRIQPLTAGCARSSSRRSSATVAPSTACSARPPGRCFRGPRGLTTPIGQGRPPRRSELIAVRRLSASAARVGTVLGRLVHLALLAVVPHFGPAFVVVGENAGYREVTAQRAPYVTGTLRPRGAWLSGYRAFGDSASLGQYVAMVSGQYTRCEARDGEPRQCAQSVPSLFSQLDAARRPWRTWMGAMPSPCARADAGLYAAHHNPAPYFKGLRASCASSSLPLDGFGDALAAGRVGDLNVVVPDNCD